MCQRLSSRGWMQSPPLKMGVFCICRGRARWAVRQSRALQQIQGFCMLRGIVGSLNPYIWGAKSWRGGCSFGLWDFISFSRWWPTIMVGVAGILPIGESKGKKNMSEFWSIKHKGSNCEWANTTRIALLFSLPYLRLVSIVYLLF